MERSDCDYRNQNFKSETEFNEHIHGHIKKRNLSIRLPSARIEEQNNSNQINQTINQTINPNSRPNCYSSNLTSKSLTPFVPNFDELKSPILFKESMSNPFAETFKQAALSPLNKITNFDNYDVPNNYEDKNESLSTPLIDLKSFEQKIKLKNCSKLDLLITADQLIDNLFDNNSEFSHLDKSQLDKSHLNKSHLDKIHLDKNQDKNECNNNKISDKKKDCYLNDETPNFKINTSSIQSKTSEFILPKIDASIEQDQRTQLSPYNVSYILRLPNGGSLPISVEPSTHQSSTINTDIVQSSNVVQSLNQQTSSNLRSNNSELDYNNVNSNFSVPNEQKINEINESSNKQIQNNKSKEGKKRNLKNKRTPNTKKMKKNLLEEQVETTTLKSIKDALTESNALPVTNQTTSQQLDSPFSSTQLSSPHSQMSDTTDLIKCESYSTSSQSSNSSSLFYQSAKTLIDDSVNSQLNLVDSSSCSTIAATSTTKQSKVGRKSKNQPKEDRNLKKARSLERNRAAASRCRTKRKVWMSALEVKADELEKQNKKLNKDYENLKRDVQKFKSYLIQFTKTNGLLDENCLSSVASDNLTNSSLIDNQISLNSKLNSSVNSPVNNSSVNSTNCSSICNSTVDNESIQTEPISGQKSSNLLDLLLAAAKRENTMCKANTEF